MQTKPTILLVIEGTYPWYRGGVSEWVHQYIKAFNHVQFSILQIATDEYRNNSFEAAVYELADHITSFTRIPPPEMNSSWEIVSEAWFSSQLNHIKAPAEQVDVIHVANTGFAGWLGMKLASRYAKSLVLTEHALYWKEVKMGAVALECGYKIPQHEQGKTHISELFKNIARKVYQASDQIISVSECNIPKQEKLGAESVKYIPNGVEKSWIKQDKTQTHTQTLTLGWIGRCAEMKNPMKFFELADELGSYVNCLMMLCDAAEPDLKKKVIDQSKRHSNVKLIWNRPAIEHIDKMDALCITSHNESQPLVMFEALSRKVLPVGWTTGDVTEKYAVVIDQERSVQNLAQVISSLWNNPEEWQSELHKRFRQVKENHTWQAVFDQYRSAMQPYITSSVNPHFE